MAYYSNLMLCDHAKFFRLSGDRLNGPMQVNGPLP